jgi:transcriptional regulator with XRE-family HTH domain
MSGYSQKVGARLRSLRKQRGLTLQQVEVLSSKRLKGSLLAAYERGDRNISVSRLHQIAMLYAVPVTQLLPDEPDAGADLDAPSKMAVDLEKLSGLPERQSAQLSRHIATLQQQRRDFDTGVVTFRTDDLEQLAQAYRTTPEMLRRSLQEWGILRRASPPSPDPSADPQEEEE